MPIDPPFEIEILDSIAPVGREGWDACFPTDPERFDYLLAVERAALPGFDWFYLVAKDAEGRVLAAMPGFETDYALETTLDHRRTRQVVEKLRRLWPGFLKLRLCCLGSPCTENAALGMHPAVPQAQRPALFARLLEAFEAHAKRRGAGLLALKDVPAHWPDSLNSCIAACGYARLESLATARLSVDFPTIDAYLSRLSKGMRKDLRRKLRSRDQIRMLRVNDLSPWREEAQALYLATRARSDWQFEELTEAYFQGILERMPDRSFVMLYFHRDRLLATNLLIEDPSVAGGMLIDKFFCMNADAGREWNLYYLSWIVNIEYCLSRNYAFYQSGQAYYTNKLRLGSYLLPNNMFFRHRIPLLQAALRLVSPLFAADAPDRPSTEVPVSGFASEKDTRGTGA